MDNVFGLAADRYRAVSFPQKKKKQKENTKEQLSNVQMYNSTIGKDSTNDTQVNSTNDTIGNRSQDPERPKRLRKDIEVDQYLFSLLNDGFITLDFKAWHARAIYTLGFERYHSVVIDVRRAKQEYTEKGKECNAARLLAYKIKGRLELHFKEKFTQEDYGV